MKIYDISVPLNSRTPVWPGDAPIAMTTLASREQGQDYHLTQVQMISHCGTHLDAPFHFLPTGMSLPNIPLSRLILPALVVAYDGNDHISVDFVRSIDLRGLACVLFKTRNSQFWQESTSEFWQDFLALTAAAAGELVANGIQLVGIDYLSIDPFESEDNSVHRILLGHDVLILEGLNLWQVAPGEYQLICLPLKLDAPDGAPVRAVLLKD